jgi:DNA processing protein
LFDASQLKLSKDERRIYDYLGKEPVHIEQIIGVTNLTPGRVNAGLISLRLKGLIKQLPGSLFLRS